MKINFYGDDSNYEVNTFEPSQPTEEQKLIYKKFRVLTISAFALLIYLLFQGMIMVGLRLLFVDDILTKTFALGIEVFILAMCISICVGYKYLNHYLSYANLGAIVGAELIFIVAQLFLFNFCVPFLYYILIFVSIIFAIYILKFLNCKFKIRVLISLIPVLILITTGVVYLRGLVYTPRYIYISNNGYSDKVSDNSNYYYNKPVNGETDDGDYIDEILLLTNTMSNTIDGIFSVEDFDYLEDLYSRMFSANDVINFHNRYNEEFFKNNCLYFSIIELENKYDTVKCTEIQQSYMYARPVIEYTKSTIDKGSEDRAICIMVFEVTLEEYKEKFDTIAGFTVDKAKFIYK